VGPAGLCGVGELGEIVFRSPHLAAGYLDDPAATAARFVQNPLGGAPGDRAYRTGDLGRYDAAGDVLFAGRADRQVKIRGFRIELEEIEYALAQHPQIATAVVEALGDGAGKRLVAWIVPKAGAAPSVHELEAHIKTRLPDYMVPAAFATLERLPLTANGKLDRRALPTPEVHAEAFVEPATDDERVLAALWAEVLGVPRVGRDDDFFELGGHSLTATQVVARVRRDMGVAISVRTLFDRRSLRDVAAALRERHGAQRANWPPLRLDRRRPLPTTMAQRRIWFFQQRDPESSAQHLPIVLRLRGALDPFVLERALDELVRRHEILRTTYLDRGGELRAVVHEQLQPGFDVIDVDDPSPEAVLSLVRAEIARPFDLRSGSPIRAAVLRLSDDESVLVTTIHHIATDGWSNAVMFDELSALYDAFAAEREPELPNEGVAFADFAAWQEAWLATDECEAQVAYWCERLRDAPALSAFPSDRPAEPSRSYRGAVEVLDIPPDVVEQVAKVARAEGGTPFMVLLAAYYALLAGASGRDDLVVGILSAGRTHAEIERTVGYFPNVLPLRVRVESGAPFRVLLRAVRTAVLDGFAHQEVPFERVLARLDVERLPNERPLIQAIFALQNAPRPQFIGGGIKSSVELLPLELSTSDVAMHVYEVGQGRRLEVEYDTDRFDAAAARRLGERFVALLREASRDPQRPLRDLAVW
jgi:acyl carrier protein